MGYTLRCTRHRLDTCRYCPRPKRAQRLTTSSTWRFYDDSGLLTSYMIGETIASVIEAVAEFGSSWEPGPSSGSYGGGSSYDSGGSSGGGDSSW